MSDIIIALVYGTVGSIIATYIVRYFDNKHENDRQQ